MSQSQWLTMDFATEASQVNFGSRLNCNKRKQDLENEVVRRLVGGW